MKLPWWRRVLCTVGWHSCEAIGHRYVWGYLLRCVYCGTDDYEDDWVSFNCCWKRRR